MPVKVILKITKGKNLGKEFIYDEKECIILGRHKDCHITFPEGTVSRYHCLLDIAPPYVMVRDFGSLNGTYLNGKKIGQRDTSISAEQARKQRYNEYIMNSGDRLGLGKCCEVTLKVIGSRYCSECFREINSLRCAETGNWFVCDDCNTRLTENSEESVGQEVKYGQAGTGQYIPDLEVWEEVDGNAETRKQVTRKTKIPDPRIKQKKEEKQRIIHRAVEEAAYKIEKSRWNNRKCEICGDTLYVGRDEPNICPACQKDSGRIFDFVMKQASNAMDGASEITGYRKIEILGEGTMGVVWLVEEVKTGKQMALKLMLPSIRCSEEKQELFIREAYLSGQLNHKNVVKQFKNGRSGDIYFILMEFCQGGSVDKLIKKNGGKLGFDLATHIILQVLDGLHYTHNTRISVVLKDGTTEHVDGVVHRDFKPGNIFLTGDMSNPVVKIADFGLAKAFETAGMSKHTRTGDVAGTPEFMPRQQVIDYRFAQPAVDVWAAAACYYFMLTGYYPKDFTDDDPFGIALNDPPVPIQERGASIPEKMAKVIDAALVEIPEIGIQKAIDLKEQIEKAL